MFRPFLAVPAAVMLAVCIGAAPAYAAEPAGTGLDITAASVSGAVISWSGSYSCEGLLAGTLTVSAVDNAGNQASTGQVITCPAAGAPVSGTLDNGLLGLGGNWGSQVTLTVTGSGLLSGQRLETQVVIIDGGLDEVTVDSAQLSGGDLRLSGGFSCDSAGTATLTTTASQSTGAGSVTGTRTVSLTCPAAGTQAPWTATIVPAAAAQSTAPDAASSFGAGPIASDTQTTFMTDPAAVVTVLETELKDLQT